jgi:hypothetical protein
LGEATQSPASLKPDPGSYRDWDGRVYVDSDRVLRALTPGGVANWNALAASELFARRTAEGALVATRAATADELQELRESAGAPAWAAALVHERIPFVSYPYEWTFSMLQDAALVQLALVADALDEALTMKDASPYNIQWRGSRPVFIDVGSFEPLRPGEAWAGYRQFCSLYLYPLLMEAYLGVPFQPWLRGAIDGISPRDAAAMLGARHFLRRGVLRHVFLHARLERGYASSGAGLQQELADAGLDARVIARTIAGLTKLVGRLNSARAHGAWSDYHSSCSYDDADREAKTALVSRTLARTSRSLVWDLGCNDGRHAELAAQRGAFVLALDNDTAVVDSLYRRLRAESPQSILPLVVDLADPSPSLGWRNLERRSLGERGRPDLVLCLALVHHLAIGRNLPMSEIVDWLCGLEAEVVIEFPHRNDPMVRKLLDRKRDDAHPDYDRASFEGALQGRFEVQDSLDLPSGVRTLYVLCPR